MKNSLSLFIVIFLYTNSIFSQVNHNFYRINGPYGGQPTCMISNDLAKGSNPIFFAGSSIRGLFANKTGNWEMVNDTNINGFVIMINVSASKDLFVSLFNKGLFSSKDNGETWTKMMTFKPFIYSTSICTPKSNRILTTMSDRSYYISEDDGNSWNLASSTDSTVYTKMIHFKDSIVFSGTNKYGVYVSKDFGTSFIMTDTTGFRSKNVRDLLITDKGLLFAATAKGLYRSSNLGNSWIELTNGIYVEDSRHLFQLNDSTIFLATSIGLYYTTDLGDSWSEIDKKTDIVGVNAIVKTKNDEIIVSGSYGIFKSSEKWTKYEEMDYGFSNLSLSKILAFNSQSKEYILTSSLNKVLYQINDPTSSQGNVRFRGITFITFSWSPWGDIFCTSGMGGVLRSRDNGETFEQFYTNNSRAIESFSYDSKGNMFAALALGAVKSTDKGENWDLYNTGVKNRKGISIAIDSKENLYLLTSDSGLFKTLVDKDDWQKIVLSEKIPLMRSLIINKKDEVFIVSDSLGIIKTNNDFKNLDYIFKKNRLKRVIINRADQLIAATSKRIFLSNDNGVSWDSTSFGWNSPLTNIIDISINHDNRLYVIDEIGVSASFNLSDVKPSAKNISSMIYPNPVKNKVFISCDKSGEMEFIIYNIDGSEISRGVIASDNSINVEGINNGIYFLSINKDKKQVLSEKFEILR